MFQFFNMFESSAHVVEGQIVAKDGKIMSCLVDFHSLCLSCMRVKYIRCLLAYLEGYVRISIDTD